MSWSISIPHRSRDESLVDVVLAKEDEVNALHLKIDEMAVSLIATQQPVGKDVRLLFMASKIVTDLERIADQAKNIVQNAHYVLAQPLTELSNRHHYSLRSSALRPLTLQRQSFLRIKQLGRHKPSQQGRYIRQELIQ